jgi:hypothetical protein
MKFGIYGDFHQVTYYICAALDEKGGDVEDHEGCLCELHDDRLEDLEDIVIVHPHQLSVECWKKIRCIIEKSPERRFYVYGTGLDSSLRRDTIGSFPNLKYVSGLAQNGKSAWDEILGFLGASVELHEKD